MKKSKKSNAIQKIIIVGSVLIVLQVVYIYIFNSEEPPSAREAINAQIDKIPGTQREKEIKKILAAVHSFRIKTGKFPDNLINLTPEYFDRIPIDPETNQPFKYWLENNTPFIGEKVTLASKGGNTQDEIVASLTDESQKASFVYNATGKRDPFRPFNFAPKVSESSTATPLERYTVGQLKLTAVIAEGAGGSAMVENNLGKGFVVRKGTKIGPNGGEVIEIQKDRILVLETTVDFTGKSKTRTVEMRLRSKEADEQSSLSTVNQ
jgi:type IV pilus assembly protein PilP